MIDFFPLESTSTVLGFVRIGGTFDGEMLKIRLLIAGNRSRRRGSIIEREMRLLITPDGCLFGLNERICILCQLDEDGFFRANTSDSTSNRRFLWWFTRSVYIVEDSLMLRTSILSTRFRFGSFLLGNIIKNTRRSLFGNFLLISTNKFVSCGLLFT